MTVWLVAEDRVQLVRADRIVSFAVVPVKPTGTESSNPLERLPSWDRIRILASTGSARNIEAPHWTCLITFNGDGKAGVKVMSELTATIDAAEQDAARSPGAAQTRYIHGPIPRLEDDPMKTRVWTIAEELPGKKWPTSGSFFRDPLP
jgi:hypothetical protein